MRKLSKFSFRNHFDYSLHFHVTVSWVRKDAIPEEMFSMTVGATTVTYCHLPLVPNGPFCSLTI